MIGGSEIVILFFWLVSMLVGVGGAIILLIAIWKLMKAHEALAVAVQEIARTIKQDRANEMES